MGVKLGNVDIKGAAYSKGVWEQGVEEYIWTEER
jgi:hypothetical protein